MDQRRTGTAICLGLTLLSGLLLLAGEAPAPFAAPAKPSTPVAPQVQSPLASGPAADLNLAFTAQVIGWIEPCG